MHSSPDPDGPQDSGLDSSAFDTSALFPSTPKKTTRKRKWEERSLPPSPQFCSTFNESLVEHFRDLDVNHAATPDRSQPSPMQESHRILYGPLKHVRPDRKTVASPRIFKSRQTPDRRQPLQRVVDNHVVMDKIFGYLSSGELYRLSMVSRPFRGAITANPKASERLAAYRNVYRDNKENYVITPPASPEKSPSPPVHNMSHNFAKYLRVAKKLSRGQTLGTCRTCNGLTIIENEVSQCQNLSVCGLIYCHRCPSYSTTGPKDFHDKCGHSILRTKLANVSNRMEESFYAHSFEFSSQDSGFQSEAESSPLRAKRVLFSRPNPEKGALKVHNREGTSRSSRSHQDQLQVYEVVLTQQTTRQSEDECDSPPRNLPVAGSMRSKRSLRRLTR